MRRTHGLAVTLALVFSATWSLANIGLGADSSDSVKKAGSSTDQAASQDQRHNPQPSSDQQNGADDEENAQHHAALGVSLAESDGHVRVIAVLPGSPAARAGLRAGDQIRYVGDQRIRTAQGLTEEIGEYRPGAQVELSIRRDDEKRTLHARLASQESTFRSRERWNRNVNNQNDGRWNADQQANRGGRTAYSYDANDGQSNASQLSQQVRLLQQQVARLQQEMNELQAGQTGNRNQTGRTQDGRYRDSRRDADRSGQQNRAASRDQQSDRDEDPNND